VRSRGARDEEDDDARGVEEDDDVAVVARFGSETVIEMGRGGSPLAPGSTREADIEDDEEEEDEDEDADDDEEDEEGGIDEREDVDGERVRVPEWECVWDGVCERPWECGVAVEQSEDGGEGKGNGRAGDRTSLVCCADVEAGGELHGCCCPCCRCGVRVGECVCACE
jgi:hypothetical protein